MVGGVQGLIAYGGCRLWANAITSVTKECKVDAGWYRCG